MSEEVFEEVVAPLGTFAPDQVYPEIIPAPRAVEAEWVSDSPGTLAHDQVIPVAGAPAPEPVEAPWQSESVATLAPEAGVSIETPAERTTDAKWVPEEVATHAPDQVYPTITPAEKPVEALCPTCGKVQ